MPVQLLLFLFAFVNAGVVVHGVERGAWAVTVGALVGRPAGTLLAVGVSLALGLRLPRGVGWRELVVMALAASCAFTFALFFATAIFATGPVLTEAQGGRALDHRGWAHHGGCRIRARAGKSEAITHNRRLE